MTGSYSSGRLSVSDAALPRSASAAWQDKPLVTRDARQGAQEGLKAFLDQLRRLDYVEALETTQYHPDLVVAHGFTARPDDPGHLTGWFASTDEQSTTQFEVRTTARTREEQAAVLRDLRRRFLTQ